MYDKLDFILNKYEELSLRVSEPELIANQPEWRKTVKEMSDMEPMLSSGVSFFPSFLNLDIIVRFKGYLPLLL